MRRLNMNWHWEKFFYWTSNGRNGVARIRLMTWTSRRHGLVGFVGFMNWKGCRLPAGLLCPVLDRALGAGWRASPHTDDTHPPCEVIHFPRSGRVQIRCGSPRGTLRITPNGGVENFEIPRERLAAMVGPGGISSLFPLADDAEIEC